MPAAPSPAAARWTCLALVLVCACAAVLRLAALGQEDLWLDEVFTAQVAQAPDGRALLAALSADVTPPLPFLAARAALALEPWLGLEAALRLPNALAGLLAVPCLFALVAPRQGARAALLAAALLALHVNAVQHAREARFYGLTVGLSALLLLLDARLRARWRAPAALGWGACAAALVACHTLAAVLPAALGVGLALHAWRGAPAAAEPARAARVGRVALACGVALLLLLPVLWLASRQVAVAFAGPGVPTSFGNLEWALKDLGGVTRASSWRLGYALLLGLGALGAHAAWRAGARDEVLVVAFGLAAPLLALHVLPPRQIVPGRYFLCLLPLALALEVRGAGALAALLARWRGARAARAATLGLAVALLVGQAVPLRHELRAETIGYRHALAWLAPQVRPGDRVFVQPHGVQSANECEAEMICLRFYAPPALAACFTDAFRLPRDAPPARGFALVTLKPRAALRDDAAPAGGVRLGPRAVGLEPDGVELPAETLRRLRALERALPAADEARLQAAYGRWLDP